MSKEHYIVYDDSGTILRFGTCGIGGVARKRKNGLNSGNHIKEITGSLIFNNRLDLTHRVKRGASEDDDIVEKKGS